MDRYKIVLAANRSIELLERYRVEYLNTFERFGEAQGPCIFTIQDGSVRATYFGVVLIARTRFVCVDSQFFDEVLFEWVSPDGVKYPVWKCFLDQDGNVRLSTASDANVFGWLGSPDLCRKTSVELILSVIEGEPMRL